VNDTLQSGLVPGCGSSVPDGDGGGEDGLDDGRVEVHHHRLWQVEFPQLPQEIHPLLGFFDDFRSWVMMEPRKRKDSTMFTGDSHRVMGVGGVALFLKSTILSTVVTVLSNKLFSLHQVSR